MIEVSKPIIKDCEYDVLDFGSLSNDPFENQQTIQFAIDSVSNLGGGHLNLVPGYYKVGPLSLKSGVDLVIPFNCYLKFVKEERFYKTRMFDYEGMEAIRTNSPIEIHGQSNCSITGLGTIDGCGDDWRPVKNWKLTNKQWEAKLKKFDKYLEEKNTLLWYPSESSLNGAKKGRDNITLEESQKYYDFFRPVLISIYKSDKVLIQGIADCVFEEDGKLVLVDYKTDSVDNEEELLSRYVKQISFYKTTIAKTLKKEVSQTLLYSFSLNKCCYYK